MLKKHRNTMVKGDDGGRLFFMDKKYFYIEIFLLTNNLFLYRINI